LARYLLRTSGMKRAEFKVFPGKGGWLRTSIVPINAKQAGTFGLTDTVMICAFVLAVMTVARILIAH
jgi:hypothetical protein